MHSSIIFYNISIYVGIYVIKSCVIIFTKSYNQLVLGNKQDGSRLLSYIYQLQYIFIILVNTKYHGINLEFLGIRQNYYELIKFKA